MTKEEINVPSGPSVVLNRIDQIQTHEVMEVDLEQLDAAVSSESQALGFATASAGTFAGTLVGAFSSFPTGAIGAGVYVGIMGISAISTCWFSLAWRRARKVRPRLLDRIRGKQIAAVARGQLPASPAQEP